MVFGGGNGFGSSLFYREGILTECQHLHISPGICSQVNLFCYATTTNILLAKMLFTKLSYTEIFHHYHECSGSRPTTRLSQSTHNSKHYAKNYIFKEEFSVSKLISRPPPPSIFQMKIILMSKLLILIQKNLYQYKAKNDTTASENI